MSKGNNQHIKVLVVEDHLETASTIALYLENSGFTPRVIHNGIEALKLLEGEEFDLVILDIMLPGMDGRSVLERLRESSDTPVILLTALGTENQKIEGFNLGADDYVVKPFSPKELIARVKARLKSNQTLNFKKIENGPYLVVIEERRAECAGSIINLTPTEFDLFSIFMSSPLRVFTRSELTERLFGYDHDGDDKTIATHIHNLRKNIQSAQGYKPCIRTVFGVGYCFDLKDIGG